MSSQALDLLTSQDYKWGFVTDIEQEAIPAGLNEDIIRLISAKKNEPDWMVEWRLKAYRYWEKLEKSEAEPKWANIHYPPIDYQNMVYLLSAEDEGRAEEPGRGGPETAGDLREARHPVVGAEIVGWSGGGCGV